MGIRQCRNASIDPENESSLPCFVLPEEIWKVICELALDPEIIIVY